MCFLLMRTVVFVFVRLRECMCEFTQKFVQLGSHNKENKIRTVTKLSYFQ